MRNGGRSQTSGGPRSRSLGQYVNLHAGVFVQDFGPAPYFHWENFKSRNGRAAQKIINPIRGQDHVEVLRHSPDVTVIPHRPTASDRSHAVEGLQEVIHRANDAPIAV